MLSNCRIHVLFSGWPLANLRSFSSAAVVDNGCVIALGDIDYYTTDWGLLSRTLLSALVSFPGMPRSSSQRPPLMHRTSSMRIYRPSFQMGLTSCPLARARYSGPIACTQTTTLHSSNLPSAMSKAAAFRSRPKRPTHSQKRRRAIQAVLLGPRKGTAFQTTRRFTQLSEHVLRRPGNATAWVCRLGRGGLCGSTRAGARSGRSAV